MFKFLFNSIWLLSVFISLCWSGFVYGNYMSGNVYEMESDSVNFGGARSVSESYKIDDVVGQSASGPTAGDVYSMDSGFLQSNDGGFLSLSFSDTALVLSPSLGGLSGGYSNGFMEVHVVTDSDAGYDLFINSEASPALVSSDDSLDDYLPAGESPDYEYVVGFGDSNFGFSPEGSDIASSFKDDGEDCGVGNLDTPNACWDGLSTSQIKIANSGSSNYPDGATTTIKFRAGVGASRVQIEGWYYATTTVTAVML